MNGSIPTALHPLSNLSDDLSDRMPYFFKFEDIPAAIQQRYIDPYPFLRSESFQRAVLYAKRLAHPALQQIAFDGPLVELLGHRHHHRNARTVAFRRCPHVPHRIGKTARPAREESVDRPATRQSL